uniref:Uncharacterized protein n=1 Tax=Arundo donax TaxID=35708 RepID=A0A0A8XX83_ARUDO
MSRTKPTLHHDQIEPIVSQNPRMLKLLEAVGILFSRNQILSSANQTRTTNKPNSSFRHILGRKHLKSTTHHDQTESGRGFWKGRE